MVVSIWSSCLQQCVLGCQEQGTQPLPPEVPRELPVGQLQLGEVVEMLADIQRQREVQLGSAHSQVAVVHLVKSLALLQLVDRQQAQQELESAKAQLSAAADDGRQRVQEMFDRVSAHMRNISSS